MNLDDLQKIIDAIWAFDNEIVNEDSDQPEFFAVSAMGHPDRVRVSFVDENDNVRSTYLLTIEQDA